MVNISKHLKKEYWKRRIVGDKIPKMPVNSQYYTLPKVPIGEHYQLLTQSDLLNEIEPSAHEINSRFMSTRPIKEVQIVTDANGQPIIDKNGKTKKKWVVVGYDDIETTRYGYQKRIALSKAAHFAGDGFSINNEQVDKSEEAHNRFDNLNSWKDVAGLDMAFMEAMLSCWQTGDAGVFLFTTPNGSIDYKVYSFLDNYQIFPSVDDNLNKIYLVLYAVNGKNVVDIYSPGKIETWVQADLSQEQGETSKSWVEKIKNWLVNEGRLISEDGWTRISVKDCQIGDNGMQFVYFRDTDIPSGVAQEDIAALERSSSYVAEEVKATAFDELFIKATEIETLPAIGSHGKVIAVKGDADSLRASDAKRLAPSDISNIATIDLKEKKDSIMHGTMSVIVEPELLRSGADSSSAMRLCFNDEVKWAKTKQPKFYKQLKELVEILKALVAKIEKDGEYINLRTSVSMNIWVPQNFSEAVDNVTKLVYAGVLSRENARHELDVNYPDDMDIVNKEADAKLYRETFVPIKAKAEAEKETGIVAETPPETTKNKIPGVTNQATNK